MSLLAAMRERRALRVTLKIGATLLAFVVGSVTGLASTAVHDKNWAWFLLAVVTPGVAAWAHPAGWLRLGFTAGWIGLLLLALQGTAAGSYAISADLRGYLFLACGMSLMVAAIVTLPSPPRRTVDDKSGSGRSSPRLGA